MRTTSCPSENTNQGLEVIKRNQIENLELKSTIPKILEIHPEGNNSRFDQAKERISKFEDRSIEMSQCEEQNEKKE